MRELPNGWTQATLGDVSVPGVDQSGPQSSEFIYIDISSIDVEAKKITTPKCLSAHRAPSRARQNVQSDDIVVSLTRPNLNAVALITPALSGSIASTGFHVIRPLMIEPRWIYFFVQSRSFVERLVTRVRGVVYPAVRPKDVVEIEIPLPPLAEQRRIVAEIEKQVTLLDAASDSICEVEQRLERYLNSALPRFCALPDEINADGSAPLPRGWKWLRVRDLGDVKLGRQRSPQHHFGTHMRPYLRVANVFEERIDTRSVFKMNFTPEEYETFALNNGDILLNEGQSLELVGRPAIYRDEVPGACFQNTLVRFRSFDTMLPEYALIVFRAYLRTGRFRRIAKWTTNIAHLGANRFAEMFIPVPSTSIQSAIVETATRDLTLLANLKAEVLRVRRRSVRLRQAILAKAFSGQLVPQDPNDEPASVLLERIRAERGRAGKAPAKSRRSRSRMPEPALQSR